MENGGVASHFLLISVSTARLAPSLTREAKITPGKWTFPVLATYESQNVTVLHVLRIHHLIPLRYISSLYNACMWNHFIRVWLCATLWTAACQAPQFMGFFRQEYWSGLPCPLPGDLPHPGIEPVPLTSPALAGRLFTSSITWWALSVQ